MNIILLSAFAPKCRKIVHVYTRPTFRHFFFFLILPIINVIFYYSVPMLGVVRLPNPSRMEEKISADSVSGIRIVIIGVCAAAI